MSKSKNVLVYRFGQLGDTLVALPAIQAISRKHSGSRLVLLTDRHATARGYVSSWDVLAPTGLLDEVIFYEPRDLSTLGRIKQTLVLLLRLRHYRFTHIYNLALRNNARSAIRDRFFFGRLVRAQRYLGMNAVSYPPMRERNGHLPLMTPAWRRLLQRVDKNVTKAEFRLTLSESARAEVVAAWPYQDDSGKRHTIALAPGSKMSAKLWPEARFYELGKCLLRTMPDLQIVIVGGPEDTALGDRLCVGWGSAGFNLAGKLSIYGSAAVIDRCALFIGNDSGTMHLAAAVGVPCIAIFSARDYPGLWEPYGCGHTILRKDVECSGCMLETCVERGNACLKLISVQEVLEAAIARLSQLRSAPL